MKNRNSKCLMARNNTPGDKSQENMKVFSLKNQQKPCSYRETKRSY